MSSALPLTARFKLPLLPPPQAAHEARPEQPLLQKPAQVPPRVPSGPCPSKGPRESISLNAHPPWHFNMEARCLLTTLVYRHFLHEKSRSLSNAALGK